MINTKKIKWIYYTVGIGLVPLIIRFLMYIIIVEKSNYEVLNTSEIIFFGLTLCISNINEIELINTKENDERWIIHINYASILSLIIFSLALGIVLFNNISPGKINMYIMNWIMIFITILILGLTLTAYKKLNSLSK